MKILRELRDKCRHPKLIAERYEFLRTRQSKKIMATGYHVRCKKCGEHMAWYPYEYIKIMGVEIS